MSRNLLNQELNIGDRIGLTWTITGKKIRPLRYHGWPCRCDCADQTGGNCFDSDPIVEYELTCDCGTVKKSLSSSYSTMRCLHHTTNVMAIIVEFLASVLSPEYRR